MGLGSELLRRELVAAQLRHDRMEEDLVCVQPGSVPSKNQLKTTSLVMQELQRVQGRTMVVPNYKPGGSRPNGPPNQYVNQRNVYVSSANVKDTATHRKRSRDILELTKAVSCRGDD